MKIKYHKYELHQPILEMSFVYVVVAVCTSFFAFLTVSLSFDIGLWSAESFGVDIFVNMKYLRITIYINKL